MENVFKHLQTIDEEVCTVSSWLQITGIHKTSRMNRSTVHDNHISYSTQCGPSYLSTGQPITLTDILQDENELEHFKVS